MPAVAVINEIVKIDAIIETREIMAAPKDFGSQMSDHRRNNPNT